MRYIGGKTLLLENIKEVIDRHTQGSKSFFDIFSGTSVVARYFKKWYEVYSNDVLYFSYCLQRATIECPSKPRFETLDKAIGIDNPIQHFNQMNTVKMETLPVERRFFQNNYSPIGGRMYVNDDNALRIDYSRNVIEDWKNQGYLSDNEYYYLVASIIEGIPFVSNISGTYGAYHKIWDKRTFKKFELIELEVIENGKNNKSYQQDGIKLLTEISGDILYVDPPYNERQYLPNYHLLETAAKYDNPKLKGVTGQREYGENQKSDFCSQKTALNAFDELISNANFKHIILSYNTDGIMSVSDIEQVMKKYGIPDTFEINYIDYRRYKSRKHVVNNNELKEMLIYIQKDVK